MAGFFHCVSYRYGDILNPICFLLTRCCIFVKYYASNRFNYMPSGRLKEDLSSLPDNWQEEILALYAEGASDVEVKAQIWRWRGSFSDDLWYRWIREEAAFSGTIKKGQQLEKAWWQNQGRTNMKDPKFNSTLWYMNMKNRFGWADKQKIDTTITLPQIQIEVTDPEVADALRDQQDI